MFDRFHAEAEKKLDKRDKQAISELENLMMATGLASKFVDFMAPPAEKPTRTTIADMCAERRKSECETPLKQNDLLTGLAALKETEADDLFEKIINKYSDGDSLVNRVYGLEGNQHRPEVKAFLLNDVGSQLDQSHLCIFTYNRMILQLNQMIGKHYFVRFDDYRRDLVEHRNKLVKAYGEFRGAQTLDSVNAFSDAIFNAGKTFKKHENESSSLAKMYEYLAIIMIATIVFFAVVFPPMLAICVPATLLALTAAVISGLINNRMGRFLNTFGAFPAIETKNLISATSTPQGAEEYTTPKSAA